MPLELFRKVVEGNDLTEEDMQMLQTLLIKVKSDQDEFSLCATLSVALSTLSSRKGTEDQDT